MPQKKIVGLSKQAGSLPPLIQTLENQLSAFDKELQALKKAGLIYASEHWRKDGQGEAKYFYLLYPSKVGEKRRREYVGCDAESIQKARDGIERARKFDQLTEQRTRLLYRIDEIAGVLSRALYLLKADR